MRQAKPVRDRRSIWCRLGLHRWVSYRWSQSVCSVYPARWWCSHRVDLCGRCGIEECAACRGACQLPPTRERLNGLLPLHECLDGPKEL